MSLVLNTNIDALVAQNSLTSSGSQLATALQQLSSGLRINTAADDAAGYAIAQGMTSQINGLQPGRAERERRRVARPDRLGRDAGGHQRPADDARPGSRVAQRHQQLQDRTDLNAQFQQLMNDINSVSSQTQFNGVNLLDGTFQGATFQVGANAGQSITIGAISSSSSGAIGNYYNGATAAAGTVKTAAGASITTTAGTAGHLQRDRPRRHDGSGHRGSRLLSDAERERRRHGLHHERDHADGHQATDLKSIAAAVNQALSSAGGIVATVDSRGQRAFVLSGTAAAGARPHRRILGRERHGRLRQRHRRARRQHA